MKDASPKLCDNLSVGVVITSRDGEILLLERAKFPVGIAAPAGHIDDHGSPEQTAIDEVHEEVGLVISRDHLYATSIHERRVEKMCRRVGGDHHIWWVYEADQFSGELIPSADETKGARWYSLAEVQKLADRTRSYLAGEISDADWQNKPGLEDLWLEFLLELGYVE